MARQGKKPGKSYTKPASQLLNLIRDKTEEEASVVRRAPDEPDVFLMRDPYVDESLKGVFIAVRWLTWGFAIACVWA
ncbi:MULTISPECIES: hypothetical protein [Streptomyces violaceusniger group]|uniref:Uncharacterized protein n=1 Tax=Streptomyces antimycoticus TaxID=68175 RepID=A0ABD5JN85_9ACTN|nr:hypothetical protein [Streptomyces violaceusniger]MEE4589172.1 hypothetical protein [Streptomyces sp. DSM 41602]